MIHDCKLQYIASLDLEKAFENEEWNKVFGTIEKIGMDYIGR
jgi:hypothetical protein